MFANELKEKLGGVDALSLPVVEVYGGTYAVVSGIKKVLSVGSDGTSFALKKGSVKIEGEDIEIVEIGNDYAVIEGRVKRIEWN